MIIVDIAAGVTILDVKTYFGKDIKVIKAMPNTPASVSYTHLIRVLVI